MPTLKKKWDRLLQYSFGLTAILTITAAIVGLFVVVGIAVVIAKLSAFIK